jgi:DNA (cytosine-5)-methyltransferase 1
MILNTKNSVAKSDMKLTVGDLFCGVGGFSKGFENAGFQILFGIDMWKPALETFKNAHRNTDAILKDITKLDDSFFRNYKNKIDVIIAGPPCQGFSMSGKRNTSDERNTMYEEVARMVSVINPKIILLENVVGLLSMKSMKGHYVKDLIYKRFESLGYSVEHRILDASDYGVPQGRKRVIFICSKIGKLSFPESTHSEKPYKTLEGNLKRKKITVGDALGNLPDVGKEFYYSPKTEYQNMMSLEKKIFNHEKMNHNTEVMKRISLVPPGGNWKDIPKQFYNVGGEHSNNYRRLDSEKPSVTIKHAIKSMIIHPKYNRVITVREAARLQSFDDSFLFYGSKSDQHQQLANAVPPLLGYVLANHIKKFLQKTERLKIER